MSRRKHCVVVVLLWGTLLLAATAQAQTWTEPGDAADLPANAQIPIGTGPLTQIIGNLNFGNVDMFEIAVTGGGTFSATATGSAPLFLNPQLYLFDAAGRGVYANDDISPPDPMSPPGKAQLPAGHALTPSQPGRYFLAVSTAYVEPVSATGPIFPCLGCQATAVVGPTGAGGGSPITAWPGTPFSSGTYTIVLTGAQFVTRPTTEFDIDGDGRADPAAYRPPNAQWSFTQSNGGNPFAASWGCPPCGDMPVPGDYDGDTRMDIAVYRLFSGEWFVVRSSDGGSSVSSWGCASCEDFPVAGDYDGDGKTDLAVHRLSTGEWFILRSGSGTLARHEWGCPSCDDLPIAADYDGDGKTDVAVYRLSTGEWFIIRSSDSSLLHRSWGCPSCADFPVASDYDGDGKADVAVYRWSTGEWFIWQSSGNSRYLSWGCPACDDLPVAADYDGDGTTDIAVHRWPSGEWFILRSEDSTLLRTTWGGRSQSAVPIELPPTLMATFVLTAAVP